MATKFRKKSALMTYEQGSTKVKIRMDKNFLNMVILYIFTKSRAITKAKLIAIRKFFEIIDMHIYETNAEMYSRIIFIQTALDCILTRGIERKEIILEACQRENDPETDYIINWIMTTQDQLSLNEIKEIDRKIKDRSQYAFILFFKESLYATFQAIDTGNFNSLKEVVGEVKDEMGACLNEIRKIENSSENNVFCLKPEVVDNYIKSVVLKATDPALTFKTGIKELNDMLSPGFAPGRLFLFLGLTGGYKSSMLLQCARWIKLYNKPTLKRKDPSCIPTVLLITTENSVEETVVRLFNMCVDDKPINDWDPDEAVKAFKSTGKMVLKDGGVDIYIQYYANNELSTADLYGIINDLEDDGREVIALIFDYIKRIRPAEKAFDERIQLKNVSNELKSLAVKYEIPVITANQINRAGNMAIDAAAGEGKEDLARLLGRANIAVSWDLLENVDWSAIINIEREKKSGILYLTIKRIKIRYKDLARHSYINHPFMENSTIRLQDDIYLDKSLSIESLSSDMEGVANIGIKGEQTSRKRESVSSRDLMEEFRFDSAINSDG